MKYPVSAVFKSFQGEGHFVGYPAAFVRLAGCSVVNCSIRSECDEAPWKATEFLDAAVLAKRAADLSPGGICVITGGEPTDHDLRPLISLLQSYMMRVHLETSGVRSTEGWPLDWLTVSPKAPNYVQRSGDTLKIVVRPEWTFDNILELARDTTFFHRYLQPMTAPDGSTNLQQVMEMLRSSSNPGARWALSEQRHKMWGVP